MTDLSAKTNNKSTIKPWHIAAGTAMSFIPLLGEPGDTVVEMSKINQLEKLPLKDTFIKTLEYKGKRIQETSLFKDMFKNFNAKNLGKTLFAFWVIIDIVLFTFLAKIVGDCCFKKKD